MINIFGLSISKDWIIDLLCSLSMLAFAIAFIFTQKKYFGIDFANKFKLKKATYLQNIFFIITLSLIVICSLKSMSSLTGIQQINYDEWWQYLRLLIDGSLILIVVILVKLIILLWIASVMYVFLEDPGTRGVYKVSLFGFTLSANTTKEYIHDLAKSVDLFNRQLEIITKLNTETVTYLSKPFEEIILAEEKVADKIRQVIYNILYPIYYEFDKDIKIYVIGFDNKEEVMILDDYLKSILQGLIDDQVDIVDIFSVGKQKDRIGIAVHFGSDNLNTAIIIDARAKKDYYEISVPEICNASNLFISISSIIGWAQLANETNRRP